LSTIDPASWVELTRFKLPSRASHLVVVPGAAEWAFIEKGPVRSLGVQDISSVYLVPATRFEPPAP
jgi:hypothetical protein